MKTKKILKRLAELLSSEDKKRRAELDCLKELLQKLEKKEAKVGLKLAAAQALGEEGEEHRKRLSDKLRVLAAQRAKGIQRCSELEE